MPERTAAEVEQLLGDLIGTEYADRGRAATGSDCYGLVRLAHERLFGIALPALTEAYASAEEEIEVARAIRRNLGPWRRVDSPLPGDLVRCWLTDPALPAHLGLYLGNAQMLSTRRATGARVEDLRSKLWRHRVIDYLRHESRFGPGFRLVVIDGTGRMVRDERLPERTSLAAAVQVAGLDRVDAGFVRVLVGSHSFDDPRSWERIYPRRGTEVVLRHVPGGPLVPFLIAAASFLSAALPGAGAVAGIAGAATFGLPIGIATAIEVGAVLAYSGIAAFTAIASLTSVARGPDQADAGGILGPSASPTLSGSANTIRPYAPIPVGFGEATITPMLAAPIWTEFIGSERYATGIYVVGDGRYEVLEEEIEIGGVKLSEVQGAEVLIGEGGRFGTYDEETVANVDPATPTSRPLSYWNMESGANAITGGPSLTASGGATFGAGALTVTGGGSGRVNAGVFTSATIVLDFTQDWSIDVVASTRYPNDDEPLFAVGSGSTKIEIWRQGGRRSGVYVIVGTTRYGARRSLGAVGSEAIGVGTWGANGSAVSHLVVKYQRATGRLVVQLDGKEHTVSTGLTISAPSGGGIRLGAEASLISTERWSDRIDDIALWQRFISASEGAQRTQAGQSSAGATRAPLFSWFNAYGDTVIELNPNERLADFDSSKRLGVETISPMLTFRLRGRITRIGVDLFFDGLYRRNEWGERRVYGVGIVLQYRAVDAVEWINAPYAPGFATGGLGSGLQITAQGSIVVTAYAQNSFPAVLYWQVPEGEYEVQIQRYEIEGDNNRPGGADYSAGTSAFTVLAVRGARPGLPPITADGICTFALRVPLKSVGNQLGRVQCRYRRMLPIYDPGDPDADPVTGFTPARKTRNAAWAALHVLRDDPRAIEDDLINLDELADFATRARNCDLYIDYASNKFDTFNLITKPSRASLDLDPDGRYTVAEDRERTIATSLITARTGRSWRGTKFFFDRPHGLLVDWWDDRGNQRQMTVFDDGYSGDGLAPGTVAATKFEQVEVRGLTSESEVWEEMRIRMRAARIRDEEWRTEVPLDAFPIRRGERTQLQQPTMLMGRNSGRVIRVWTSGANATQIRLDERVIFNVGDSCGIRWRDATNTQHLTTITNPATTVPVETDVLVFSAPLAIASAPAVDHLVAFGLVDEETVPAMVREINFVSEWVAEVVCVPYAAEIFLPGAVPVDLDPIFTRRPTRPLSKAPAIPDIARIESDERYIVRAGIGVTTRARVWVAQGYNNNEPALFFQVRWRIIGSDLWTYGDPFSADQSATFAEPLEDGLTYEFQARAYNAAGDASLFGAAIPHTVIGQSAPPPDVTDVRREGPLVVWSYPDLDEVVDLRGFRVRYRYGSTLPVLWGQGIDAHRGLLKVTQFPLESLPVQNGPLTVMVKAVDESGNESVHSGVLVIGLGPSVPRNVIFSSEESLAGWPGEKVDCQVDGLVLEALPVALPFAWKKRPVTGTRDEVTGTFSLDSTGTLVTITGGAATIDDADSGFYFWFDADGVDAFTKIGQKASSTDFVLERPYKGAGTTGSGKIHRASYVVDALNGAWSQDRTQKAWEQRYRALRYTAILRPDYFEIGDEITLRIGVTPGGQPRRILYAQQGAVPAWNGDPHEPAWSGNAAAPAWSGWGDWRPWPGQLTPERRVSYAFRIEFDEVRGLDPPRVDYFTIQIDVEDRIETFEDFPITAEGSRLYVDPPFRRVRSVTIAAVQSPTPIARYEFDKDVAGPRLRFFDAAGAGLPVTVDAVVTGA